MKTQFFHGDENITSHFTTYGPHNGIYVVRNHREFDLFLGDLTMYDGTRTWTLLEAGVGIRTTLHPTKHVLRAGESIPVLVGPIGIDDDREARVYGATWKLQDDDAPLYIEELMGADSLKKDLSWLMARKGDPYSKDPKPLRGWIQPYMVWDGDGAANARYNQVLHSLLYALWTEDKADITVALATGFAHACTGYYTVGQYAGLPRPEKGKEAYGEMGDRPLWSKTWPEQLYVLKCLTGHPYLEWLWGHFLYQLEQTDTKWWDGKWGARGPARYLDALLLAYHTDPERREDWSADAYAAISHYVTLLDPTHGIWVNGTLEKTSPWMNCQLVTSIARWSKVLSLDTTWLHEMAETLAANYTDEDYGVYYRCAGPDAKVKYRTTSAWAYRCARELGYHDAAQGFYYNVYDVYNDEGVSLDGSRGANFLKDCLIMLQNCLEDYSAFGEME